MFNFINKKSTDADFQSKDSLILLEDNLSLNIKFKNNKKRKSKRVALNRAATSQPQRTACRVITHQPF